MSRRIPRAVSMHMAQNAFARCAEKVNTRKNLTLNRQAVGEVVSYTKLGRCVAQMTGGSTEVARVPGAGPIFSTEF